MNISLSALFAPENLVSRDGFGSLVPRQPAHLHTKAEPGAYLRDFSRVPRQRPFIYEGLRQKEVPTFAPKRGTPRKRKNEATVPPGRPKRNKA